MANNKTTTCASGAEGRTVALTMENYPNSLRGYDAGLMAEDCAHLARFIREAVCGIFSRRGRDENRGGRDDEGVQKGFELVCDLLVDRLEIAAGEGFSPMPLLKDLEAHHG